MSDNLIVKTHYRTLMAIHNTQTRSRTTTFTWQKESTENLKILMVEVYKCLNNVSPPFTWNYLKQKNNPYNLRIRNYLK